MPLFPFAQFELPGRLGIHDGRYLVRDAAGEADDVLVVTTSGASRRGERRRGKHARLTKAADAEALPATRATVVRANRFADSDEAEAWLSELSRDPEARDGFAASALALVNRALHAHRAATMDPFVGELSPHAAVATRIGFGDGEQLAVGQWTKAVDAPPDPGRRQRRVDALRPQERMGAVLGRREEVPPCETLLLRARLDVDGERPREAALQLEPALRATLAELGADATGDQRKDVELLRGRVEPVVRIREEALAGELSGGSIASVTETLEVCERVLRRNRILGAGEGGR